MCANVSLLDQWFKPGQRRGSPQQERTYASFESWTCSAYVCACSLWRQLKVVSVLLAWGELKLVQYCACSRLRTVGRDSVCVFVCVGLCFWSFLWRIERGLCIRWIFVVTCAKWLMYVVYLFAFSFSVEIATSCITRTSSKIVFFTIGNFLTQFNATSCDEDSLTRKSVQKRFWHVRHWFFFNSRMHVSERRPSLIFLSIVLTNMTFHISNWSSRCFWVTERREQ